MNTDCNSLEKRIKILHVPYNKVLRLFDTLPAGQDQLCLHRFDGLPPDVFVRSVHPDFIRHSFAFVLRSAEFEEVPEGVAAPEIETKYKVVRLALESDNQKEVRERSL